MRLVRWLLCSTLLAACATHHDDPDPELSTVESEVVVGTFAGRFDDTIRGGGVVAQGASLAGREDGVANTTASITIAGIPPGATVRQALLYWIISGGTDTTATINGFAVTGTQIATASDTCWGAVNNATFRADVTAQVTGNGVYMVGGLPSSTNPTAADTDGAALVVTYQDPNSGTVRRRMIRDGAITSSGNGDVVSDTFTGVASPLAGTGRFHLVVGDGQGATDGVLTFNSTAIGTNQFPGSDGSLWDVTSYNVTIPVGQANLTWSSQAISDCLAYGAAVLDFTVAVCGDAVRGPGEACEQGNPTNGDGCSSTCQIEPGYTCTSTVPAVCTPICGDGIRTGAEQCDQGNTTNGDGCSSTCQIEPGYTCNGSPSVCTTVCGDGIRTGAEQCDQGNTANGDGCSSTCQIEPGYTCNGSPSVCTTVCGDGIRAGAEQCDQGNTTNGDGCSSTCQIEPGYTCSGSPSVCSTTCGDGIRAGAEACDDGDTMGGDGCSAVCSVEPGWQCAGSTPSICTTTCGDGIRAGTEACDDGDTMGGDGCSAVCTIEPGWQCTGSPTSSCTTTCGDGIPAGTEACDDGGTTSGDGCSATCTVEPGYTCTGAPSACVTTCGDGVRAGMEMCDDGNAMPGDGCNTLCMIEPGWQCTGSPSECSTTCGDGVVAGGEACDDGDVDPGDGCNASCMVESGWQCTGSPSECSTICGDGLVRPGEGCDDGDTEPGDGCDASCQVEDGFSCTGEPSTCTPGCGDGQIAGSEECDDGNTEDGDGCSAACATERGYQCSGAPSVCATVCGDGILVGAEECDDQNTSAGDGCDATCTVEDAWRCESEPSQCRELKVAGGGCASSSGSGWLAGLAIALVLALGRRRRAGGVAAAVLVMAMAAPAQAQLVETSIPVERFRLSYDRAGILDVESARTLGHLEIDLGLWMGYANDPLTVRLGDDRDRIGSLVEHRIGAELVGAIGIGSRLELGLGVPLTLSQSEDLGDSMIEAGSISSFSLGDLRLAPKLSLLRGNIDVAIVATVTLPTASGDYSGDDGATVAPELLVGAVRDRVRLLANLGYRVRGGTTMPAIDVDDELVLRLGAAFRVAPRVEVLSSLSLATAAKDPFGEFNQTAAEVQLGLGVDLTPDLRLFGAGGLGLAEGFGSADYRVLAGLWFGRRKAVAPVIVTKPEPPRREPKDSDGDGFVDAIDKCPNEPEDKDDFDDDDGCPDPDNDGDGVADADDRCRQEPGPKENNGCPDQDTDGDTVVDRLDKCVDKPGLPADDGCPKVAVVDTRIQVLEKIYFDTNKATIQRVSYPILDEVARVISTIDNLDHVLVEGHTDDTGNDAYNTKLSQQRAAAVVSYLVRKGVSRAKLKSKGFGKTQPLGDDRDMNRRVEFKIIDR